MMNATQNDYIDITQKNFNDLRSPPSFLYRTPSHRTMRSRGRRHAAQHCTVQCRRGGAAYSFLEVSHDGNGGLSACVFFCFDYDDDDDYNSSGASVLLFTFPCANFYAHSCTSSLQQQNEIGSFAKEEKCVLLLQISYLANFTTSLWTMMVVGKPNTRFV